MISVDASESINQHCIEIALIPVGNPPVQKFQHYCNELQRHSSIELSNLNVLPNHGSVNTGDSPFRHLPVLNGGSLCFKFVQGDTWHSHWEQFHVHKRTMGIIGICHCPSVGDDLLNAYEEFQDIKRRYMDRGALVCDCYAFEPMDNQIEVLERVDLIMFPNQDAGRLRFYIATILSDYASRLLQEFQKIVSLIDADIHGGTDKSQLNLKTPLDSQLPKVSSIAMLVSSKNKKQRLGRLNKHSGDFCLLCGSPQDALVRYKVAHELTKDTHDWVWYAGTLEAMASATVLLDDEYEAGESDTNGGAKSRPVNKSIVEYFEQAFVYYSKKNHTASLQIECLFRKARYLLSHNECDSVGDLLMNACQLALECSAQDQIAVTVESGLVSRKMGSYRRFSFYLQQAAHLYGQLEQHSSRQRFLTLCAPFFGLHGIFGENRDEISALSSKRTPEKHSNEDHGLERMWERGINMDHRWPTIQRRILEEMLDAVRKQRDRKREAVLTAYMLRALYPWLDRQYQKSLAANLFSITREFPINNMADISGIPRLLSVRPVPLSAELEPICGTVPSPSSRSNDGSDDATVFVFVPSGGGGGAGGGAGTANGDNGHGGKNGAPLNVRYVAQKAIYMEAYLSNPLKFELVVQRIALATDGVAFESFPESLTLPPETPSCRVILGGKPLEPGRFSVLGCHIRAFNLTSLVRIDEVGQGLRPLQGEVVDALPSLSAQSPNYLTRTPSSVVNATATRRSSSMIALSNTTPADSSTTQTSTNQLTATIGVGSPDVAVPKSLAPDSPKSLSTSMLTVASTSMLPTTPIISQNNANVDIASISTPEAVMSGQSRTARNVAAFLLGTRDDVAAEPPSRLPHMAEPIEDSADNGSGVRVNVSNIVVVPELPHAIICVEYHGNIESELILGEIRKITVCVKNVGQIAVTSMTVEVDELIASNTQRSQRQYYEDQDYRHLLEDFDDVEASGTDEAALCLTDVNPVLLDSFSHDDVSSGLLSALWSSHGQTTLRWNPDCVHAQLPLKPGDMAVIPLYIRADSQCRGVKIDVKYGNHDGIGKGAWNGEDVYHRRLSHSIKWQVYRGLTIRTLDICPSVNSGRSDVGREDDPDNDDCMLIVELLNSGDTTFSLESCQRKCEKQNGWSCKRHHLYIEKHCTKRMIFPLARFSFGGPEDDELRKIVLQAGVYCESANAASSAVFRKCIGIFLRRIHLNWRSGDGTVGCLSLAPMIPPPFQQTRSNGSVHPGLTPAKLFRIVPDPFVFQFSLAGMTLAEHREQRASAQGVSSSRSKEFMSPSSSSRSKEFMSPSSSSRRRRTRTHSVTLTASPLITGNDRALHDLPPLSSPMGPIGSSARFMEVRAPTRARSMSPSSPRLSIHRSTAKNLASQLAASSSSPLGAEDRQRGDATALSDVLTSGSHSTSVAHFSGDLRNYYPVGDFRSIFIALTNRSQAPLYLDLVVRPYQETVNGGFDTNLQHKLLWIGSLVSSLPCIEPNQTYTHEVPVCFISMGRFHFQLYCCPRDPPRDVVERVPRRVQVGDDSAVCASPFALSVLDRRRKSKLRQQQPQPQTVVAVDTVYWCSKPLVIEAVDGVAEPMVAKIHK